MRIRSGLVLLPLFALAPVIANAQLCLGTPAFSAAPARVGVAADLTEGAKRFSGKLAFGSPKGPFAGATVSRISYDDLDETAMVYGVHAGYAAPVGTTQKAEVCPFASFDYSKGPDFEFFGSTAEISATQLGLGLAVGGIASTSETMDLIPFASLAYVRATSKFTLSGSTEKSTDDAGILTVGAGFVFSKVLTVQPNVAFAFGVEDSDPVYGIAFMFNIGTKKP
jgi:hypothetical protein